VWFVGAAIITQRAKDLAERRLKNNILTSIGSVFVQRMAALFAERNQYEYKAV